MGIKFQHPAWRMSPQELEELYKKTGSLRKLALTLNIDRDSLTKIFIAKGIKYESRKEYYGRLEKEKRDAVIPLENFGKTLQWKWERAKKEYNQIKKAINLEGIKRIVSISDLHVPFHDIEALNEIVKREAGADILVINGDLNDFYSLSRYRQEFSINPLDEIQQTNKLIEELAKHFKQVIINQANHEMRLYNYLVDNATKLMEYLRERKIEDYLEVEASNVITNNFWYIQIGDLVIGHSEDFSAINPLKSVVNFIQYLEIQNIFEKSFNAVILAHTHKQGKAFYRKKLGIEEGCLTQKPDYLFFDKTYVRISKYDTWYMGYAFAELRDGKTDFNNTGFYNIKIL